MLGWQHSQKQGTRPCRAPLALAAERLVRVALPLPGTPCSPGKDGSGKRTTHTSWWELSVRRLWFVVSL